MLYSLRMFWDCIRYDIPRGVKNLWLFRKAVWNYRWYSGHGAVAPLLRTAIADISVKKAKYGYEIDKTSNKKIAQMKRAVQILDIIIDDDFVTLAEAELGAIKDVPLKFKPLQDDPKLYQLDESGFEEERAHNRKVFKRTNEIEDELWTELCRILQGQDYSKFDMSKDWDDQFDGTGLRGWWD